MPTEQRCVTCGAELAAFATEGFCSACLLERGLTTDASPLRSFGDYELIEEIARGGMGVVYKARQAGLNRVVAVKMILSGQFASAAEMQRFRAEARAAASLQHPNIVAIHEVGEHEGQLFFSMDFIEGRNLAQLVRDGPWPAVRAAQCVRTIAEAIHYAHEHGILHRDLKPSNVLINADGKPHVTDFGLAKRLVAAEVTRLTSAPSPGGEGRGEGGRSSELKEDQSLLTSAATEEITLTGQVLGSPNFMPPEQAAGKRELVPASDVYSLGALLYHAVTGRPPFLADSISATLRLVSETEPVAPRLLVPTIPRDLETICLKCLEKDPRRRYGTARELAEELNRFLNDEPIHARPVLPVERLGRWCRRHPAVAALTTITGLLLVTVAVVSTVSAARLKRANREGQEKLRDSLLAQAHANRWSGRPGRRFDSLDVLRKAAEIRPGLDLRNEAIAAMALVDVRSVKHWFVDHARQCYQVFDRSFERYLRTHTNGTITVHRASDDRELMAWAVGGGFAVIQVDLSPDGRFLIAGLRSNDVAVLRVYDLSQRTKITFEVAHPWIRGFILSPDGRKLALVWTPTHSWTPGNDRTIATIYETAEWREVTSFAPGFLPNWWDFDSTGDRLAIVSVESSHAQIRNAQSGELIHSLAHSNGLHCVAWSPAGNLLASSCNDLGIYLWDLSQVPPHAIRLPSDATVSMLSFNGKGDILITADWRDLARIWNVNTGKELLRWPASTLSRTSDRWISCYSTWQRFELFELSTGEECEMLHFQASYSGNSSIAYSPDGQMLVFTHSDGLCVWDPVTPSKPLFIPHRVNRAAQFARDGSGFISLSTSELLWWPVTSNHQNGTNYITIGAALQVDRKRLGSSFATNRLVIAANSKAYVIDAPSLGIESRIAKTNGVYSAALSPDGRECATWSLNSTVVEVWNVDEGRPVVTLSAPHAVCLGFSPDGRWLVTGSAEEYIFWERSSWTQGHSISRRMTGGSHGRIAFTPDGKLVALSVGRGDVALFAVDPFAPVATFEAPEGNAVSGIAFSPDGAQLAVSTQGPEIRLWNLAAVRRQLAQMKLDYDLPPLSPARNVRKPIKIIAASPSAFTPAPTR